VLDGKRVTLTPLRKADMRVLFRWINDRAQVLLNAPYHPVSQTEHRTWFEGLHKRKDVFVYGIRRRVDMTLIGSCQLHSIHPIHRSAELQIRIGEVRARGKGYGTEALRLLLDFGFRDLNLHRIYLHVFKTNTRAIRLYKKCGFRTEGVLREHAWVDGEFVDVLVMAKLRAEHV
jgi:RimJ/RimL family protein N-acetyltransferase